MTQPKLIQLIDYCYKTALKGLPGVESADQLAAEYMREEGTLEQNVNRLIKWQIARCAASGFVSGLGGVLTLPLAIPLDLGANYFIQLRMVAAIAIMCGYDVRSDKVRALAFICLCGNSAKELLKDLGIQVGKKVAANVIQKITGATIAKVNQAVGFRLLTKAGERGLVNLGRAVPLVGGVIGGAIDATACSAVGKVSKKVFLESSS